MKHFIVLIVLVYMSNQTYSQEKHQEYFPDPDTAIQHRLEQWQDLKFGLLMHWGAYSQWGIVESWSICPEDLSWAEGGQKKNVAQGYFDYVEKYESLPSTFNPVKFDPDKWARAAAYAGMKYVVFTTKHHDGFCMFDTKQTEYKITGGNCPFASNAKSDVTREIFKAFRNKGFWTGAYFSKPDWHSDYYWWKKFPPSDRNCNYSIKKHPQQWQKFINYTHAQIDELVSNYGKLDILWLDGGWVRKTTDEEVKNYLFEDYEGSRWARNPQNQDINMDSLVHSVRMKQPQLLVVDRAVPGVHQNYLTPEQHIPDEGLPYPWETCMTMASSWSYVPNDTYKPTDELIEKLVDIASKGGNYLLNIGPSPAGELDDTAYARLHEIGNWMQANGIAIYATRIYEVYGEGKGIRYTQTKDRKTKFVFLFDFPENKITLTKMYCSSKSKVTMLGNGAKLKWQKSQDGGMDIMINPALRASSNYVWVLQIKE